MNFPPSSHTFSSRPSHSLIPTGRLFQLQNEDDSSEASTSDQQPCTSATVRPGPSQEHTNAGFVGATEEASGSTTQAEAEAPPPPYASIDLGATASAPGMKAE